MDKKEEEKVILKVNGKTIPHALRSTIMGNLRDNKMVYIDSIGAIPNYIAIKAIIMARGLLSAEGKKLEAAPYYNDIKIDEPTDGISVKTGIRWILKIEKIQ